jgi:tRNA pseudouridine38-40 synthase
MNYKLIIQYDGTELHGWQIQAGERTVQGELTRVLSLLEGSDVQVHGSGRTDAGVHAEAQVANVHLTKEFRPEKLRAAINGNLRSDIRVTNVECVSDDFHARFSAKGKTYRYRVINGPVLSPFWNRFAIHEARELNLEAMNEGAAFFIGTHDFSAFASINSDSEDKVRSITKFEITAEIDDKAHARLLTFTVTGEGFLRYMVRSMVGTLMAVGRGEMDSVTIRTALTNRDRSLAGATAPPQGLSLIEVFY